MKLPPLKRRAHNFLPTASALQNGTVHQRYCSKDIFEAYPPNHFDGKRASRYMNDHLAARYVWHRALAEPAGWGTGGTIVRIEAAHGVMQDAENMRRARFPGMAEEMDHGAKRTGRYDDIKVRKSLSAYR
jgi:hypothetical protein